MRRPGEVVAYSDTGPQLLVAILERATGQPLLDHARKKLLDALGVDTRPAAQPEMTPKGKISTATRSSHRLWTRRDSTWAHGA